MLRNVLFSHASRCQLAASRKKQKVLQTIFRCLHRKPLLRQPLATRIHFASQSPRMTQATKIPHSGVSLEPREHGPYPKDPLFQNFFVICGPRLGARGSNPLRGHPGKRDLLRASELPTFFFRSVENEHTSPRPLKSHPNAPDGRGCLRPQITETRGQIPRPLRGPKTSGPLSRVSPLAFRPSGCNWRRPLFPTRTSFVSTPLLFPSVARQLRRITCSAYCWDCQKQRCIPT